MRIVVSACLLGENCKYSGGNNENKAVLNFVKEKKTKLYLNVYQKNTHAIHFYQREGFEIQREGLDEVTGEKDYVMVWQRGNSL